MDDLNLYSDCIIAVIIIVMVYTIIAKKVFAGEKFHKLQLPFCGINMVKVAISSMQSLANTQEENCRQNNKNRWHNQRNFLLAKIDSYLVLSIRNVSAIIIGKGVQTDSVKLGGATKEMHTSHVDPFRCSGTHPGLPM